MNVTAPVTPPPPALKTILISADFVFIMPGNRFVTATCPTKGITNKVVVPSFTVTVPACVELLYEAMMLVATTR
jgi:hypothetical protein